MNLLGGIIVIVLGIFLLIKVIFPKMKIIQGIVLLLIGGYICEQGSMHAVLSGIFLILLGIVTARDLLKNLWKDNKKGD